MTWPQKESPAEGQGLDHVGRGDLKTIYANTEENSTADVAVDVRECRLCAAFFPCDTGRGECHRYAPNPNFDHSLSVQWPSVASHDFCLEYVSKGTA